MGLNPSKIREERFWNLWKKSGAVAGLARSAAAVGGFDNFDLEGLIIRHCFLRGPLSTADLYRIYHDQCRIPFLGHDYNLEEFVKDLAAAGELVAVVGTGSYESTDLLGSKYAELRSRCPESAFPSWLKPLPSVCCV
ncbi:MAG TPA: hypothetical protein VEB60_02670 [Candidatus Paceibacterota bacterium]|nr:hypothetical protein [Candidatus Paceibacterota bacterium]